MDAQELTAFLTDTFPGSELRELELMDDGRLVAMLVWQAFEELDQIDRQNALWNALREHYERDDLRRGLGMILTFTPHEAAVIAED